jgi:hypothetical protein
MKNVVLSNYILLPFLAFSIIVTYKPLIHEVFAASPSFPRQEIEANPNDWHLIPTPEFKTSHYKPAENISECTLKQGGFPFPGMSAVSYISDGKMLNATLWFSSPFTQPNPKENILWIKKVLSMGINVLSTYEKGPDYFVNMDWDLRNKTWSKIVSEESPDPRSVSYRVLSQKENVRFFDTGQNYALLSFDLGDVNYPKQYNVIFSMSAHYIIGNHACHLLYVTDEVSIPPPVYYISPSSETPLLRPGEQKNIELQIKSSTGIPAMVSLFTNKINDIELKFIPNETSVPPLGMATSILQILVSKDAKPDPYTLPINANISFTPTIREDSSGQKFKPKSIAIPNNSDLTITILPPLSFKEHLNNFYITWLAPISGIWTFLAGIGAVIAPLIVRMYSRKQKKNKDKENHGSST